MEKLYKEFKDRADFLTIYIKEAHPTDEWQMPDNAAENICYTQPQNIGDRLTIANDFIKRFKYSMPLAVDDMENHAMNKYAAWPERLYIINEGAIVYKGGVGPLGYQPEEVRAWLEKHFQK